MREILMQALTTPENQKRDFRVQESFIKDGVLAKTEKRCFYFILGKAHIEDHNDLEAVSHIKLKTMPQKKRHYYILKIHDTDHGEDRLICKVAGSFYAVCGNELYSIAFLHSFKITFTALQENANPNGE